jgi:hypothetical protein
MLDKIRIRAFARYIKIQGEEKFLECIIKNERAGVVYHYQGGLDGDYDKFRTEEEIMNMIENGK